MGVQITELLSSKETDIKELSGKSFAVDASLFLYQFLSTIRQRDGTPLMDSQGRVTSHLTGLFSRSAKLMQSGLKLAYVFDGKAPELKEKERARRSDAKRQAESKYNEAVKKEDVDSMKKYASRTSRLTPEMVEEAKTLVSAMGMPIIQAPSEGEAQASFMAKQGDVYAVATQDADVLMFGSPFLVRNLSLIGKRKMAGRFSYNTTKPELITLSDTLNQLGIDQHQLICLSMLVGTDYNVGGVKGIGPKNALKLVKQHGSDKETLFQEVKWDKHFDFPWSVVFETIVNIPTTTDFSLEWSAPDEDKIIELLVEKHEFSRERIETTLGKLLKENEKKAQKGLGDFF